MKKDKLFKAINLTDQHYGYEDPYVEIRDFVEKHGNPIYIYQGGADSDIAILSNAEMDERNQQHIFDNAYEKFVALSQHAPLKFNTSPRPGNRDEIQLKKYKLGDVCVGKRYGSSSHLKVGTLVDAYVTVNYPYRNPAYVLRCEDGKLRTYQGIEKLEEFSDSTWTQGEKHAHAKQLENIKKARVKK